MFVCYCLLSALASAFTVPTPASQGSFLTCASPVYHKGECCSISLMRKVPPTPISPLRSTWEKPLTMQGRNPRKVPLSKSAEHWYPDGINEPRHYTDLKTIVKAPRILQEMSLMVLMVAPARPTPVIRLVLWFCHPNDWEIFRGLWNTKSQIKNIPQPRVTNCRDTTPTSLLERLIYLCLLVSLHFYALCLLLAWCETSQPPSHLLILYLLFTFFYFPSTFPIILVIFIQVSFLDVISSHPPSHL